MTIAPDPAPIAIVTYRPEYRSDFERLNRVWLESHSLMEQADLDYLQHPESLILDGGGQIFFAVQGETVVGTCAAIRISPATYELAKLAVDPSVQGRGVGRRLCRAVLDYARAAHATTIELTSHTALVHALQLYESLGFQQVPIPANVRYLTANVYMTLALGDGANDPVA
jgi:GNAT superfamily N-acetyltransferase